jgi:transposase-like protein
MMLQKLRRAMVNPERTPLTEAVEVDECFVGGLDRELRGGRQHGTKALVVVAVEVRGAGSGRLRMQVVENASTAALTGFVQDVVEAGAVVHTDGWNAYRRLSKLDYDHRPRIQRPGRVAAADLDDILPRVHRAISNLKTWLQGTHRGVSKEHLQVYLDEYTFRFNRRRTPMAAFQTLLGLGGQQPPTTYARSTPKAQAVAHRWSTRRSPEV